MRLPFFQPILARMQGLLQAESAKKARLFTLVVAMLFSLSLFSSQSIPLAHADVSCTSSVGGTCSYATNQNGNHYDCHTTTAADAGVSGDLVNSFVQGCLESYVIAGTGDNMRYFYFDVVTTTDPDEANGVSLNEGSGNGDSSQAGDNSTTQDRVWSNARTPWTTCGDGICNQQARASMQPNDVCTPSGGTHQVSGQYATGGLTISFNETEPLYAGCMNKASVPDVYSAYSDYTRMNASDTSEVTVDAVSGQWSPNNYNNRTGAIGWSYMGWFWWGLEYKIQGPNYYDWYKY